MKKFTEIFAIITSLIVGYGCIATTMHYPFGGISLLFGLGLLVAFLFVLVGISYFKKTKALVFVIINGLGAIIFATGTLFLLLHWPSGFLYMLFGFVWLFISLLIFSFIEVSKKQENRTHNVLTLVLAMIAVSLIFAATFRSVTSSVIDSNLQNYEETKRAALLVEDNSERLYIWLDTLKTKEKNHYLRLQELVSSLDDLMEKMKRAIAINANGSDNFSDLSQVKRLDEIDVTYSFFINDGHGRDLKERIDKFREFLELSRDRFHYNPDNFISTKSMTNRYGEEMPWEYYYFGKVLVINAICNLSTMQLNLRMCEMTILYNRILDLRKDTLDNTPDSVVSNGSTRSKNSPN
ncbi:MAG: hypothetical protein V2A54_03310 [Bacteroidota bacterium]